MGAVVMVKLESGVGEVSKRKCASLMQRWRKEHHAALRLELDRLQAFQTTSCTLTPPPSLRHDSLSPPPSHPQGACRKCSTSGKLTDLTAP